VFEEEKSFPLSNDQIKSNLELARLLKSVSLVKIDISSFPVLNRVKLVLLFSEVQPVKFLMKLTGVYMMFCVF
jgi:hypothetical protein